VLRLRALLRRAGVTTLDSGAQIVVLDEDSHEVTRAGEPIMLTSTEFELPRFLMRTAKPVLSKAQILDRGMELRLRRQVQHRRALHLLPAQEDRQRPRAQRAGPHGIRGAVAAGHRDRRRGDGSGGPVASG
jgi:DNA-binding response OmpR family regulator